MTTCKVGLKMTEKLSVIKCHHAQMHSNKYEWKYLRTVCGIAETSIHVGKYQRADMQTPARGMCVMCINRRAFDVYICSPMQRKVSHAWTCPCLRGILPGITLE